MQADRNSETVKHFHNCIKVLSQLRTPYCTNLPQYSKKRCAWQCTETILTIFASNFCARKLRQLMTLQPSVAIAMFGKTCFPQKRFTSKQGKIISLAFRIQGVIAKFWGVIFTPKNSLKRTLTFEWQTDPSRTATTSTSGILSVCAHTFPSSPKSACQQTSAHVMVSNEHKKHSLESLAPWPQNLHHWLERQSPHSQHRSLPARLICCQTKFFLLNATHLSSQVRSCVATDKCEGTLVLGQYLRARAVPGFWFSCETTYWKR